MWCWWFSKCAWVHLNVPNHRQHLCAFVKQKAGSQLVRQLVKVKSHKWTNSSESQESRNLSSGRRLRHWNLQLHLFRSLSLYIFLKFVHLLVRTTVNAFIALPSDIKFINFYFVGFLHRISSCAFYVWYDVLITEKVSSRFQRDSAQPGLISLMPGTPDTQTNRMSFQSKFLIAQKYHNYALRLLKMCFVSFRL